MSAVASISSSSSSAPSTNSSSVKSNALNPHSIRIHYRRSSAPLVEQIKKSAEGASRSSSASPLSRSRRIHIQTTPAQPPVLDIVRASNHFVYSTKNSTLVTKQELTLPVSRSRSKSVPSSFMSPGLFHVNIHNSTVSASCSSSS